MIKNNHIVYEFKVVEKKWIEKFEKFDGFKGKDFDSREKKYIFTLRKTDLEEKFKD